MNYDFTYELWLFFLFLYFFPHSVKYMIYFSTPSKQWADLFLSQTQRLNLMATGSTDPVILCAKLHLFFPIYITLYLSLTFFFLDFICRFVSHFLRSSCNSSQWALILTALIFEFLYCVQTWSPHSSLPFPGHLWICWTLQVPASVEYHWQLSYMWDLIIGFYLLCCLLTIYLSMLWPTYSVVQFPTSILHENLWKVLWKSKQIIMTISSLSTSVLNS